VLKINCLQLKNYAFYVQLFLLERYIWLSRVEHAIPEWLRACLNFSAEAKASKFCFRQGKICSRSRVPTAKILTQHEAKFAACSPVTEF